MGAPIILTREDILRAMRVTKSNNQAARYLGVHIGTYSKYARLYIDEESGKSLYELHLSVVIVTGKQIGRASCRERVSSPV